MNFKTPLILGATALALIGLTSCSGQTDVQPTATVTVTQQANAQEDISAPEQESSTNKDDENIGIVWASSVDPSRVNQPNEQPTFTTEQGLITRLDMLVYVNAAKEGSLSQECYRAISAFGKSDDTHCLMVQFELDVPADYRADVAGISPGSLLTPEGRQIDSGSFAPGVPGAKNVVITEMYVGGEPGSTLRWSVGSNEVGHETLKYEIPGIDAFMPLNFS